MQNIINQESVFVTSNFKVIFFLKYMIQQSKRMKRIPLWIFSKWAYHITNTHVKNITTASEPSPLNAESLSSSNLMGWLLHHRLVLPAFEFGVMAFFFTPKCICEINFVVVCNSSLYSSVVKQCFHCLSIPQCF